MSYYWRGNKTSGNRYEVRQPYYKQTKDYYETRQDKIDTQRELFELEQDLEEALGELRSDIQNYMSGRITLGQLLTDLMDSSTLCKRISVFSR